MATHPARNALATFVPHMPEPHGLFVFISHDRKRFGLSNDRHGANLPHGEGWSAYDVIPKSANYLSRYTDNTDAACADLAAQGWHMVPTRGNILPFPAKK